ncbi:MAG: hypothetical protein GKR92_12260 [Gammaproteobacteria bacterium]|nr:MAG: hypothetical protein GKR92_12260 [Gammaproteobacteria bacterium]
MVQNRIQPWYLIAIVLVLAFSRLVPHPPNAVPIAAMALFAGAFFSNRALAFMVPLAAMILSDLVIGFHSTVWYVYAGIAATVLIGSILNHVTVFRVGVAAVVASIVFYLITNFGSWLHHEMYTQNLSGLLQSYAAGLPFLRNSLAANLIFTYLIFFGLNYFLPLRHSLKSSL